MFSIPLFKQTCKNNYRIWLFFTGCLLLITVLILAVYEPQTGSKITGFMDKYPKEMMDAWGINMQDNSLTGHLSNYLYGFLLLIIPMIYIIITANRLIAKQVDSGVMSYILSSSYSRKSIALTQLSYLILSLFFMFLVIILLEAGSIMLFFPGQLDWFRFLILNISLFCLHLCISGICFLTSCICDESRTFMMIGGGLPILFYLIQMLIGTSGNLGYLRFITIFTLFDTEKILLGDIQAYWMFSALALAGLILFNLGITIFQKRDLPL